MKSLVVIFIFLTSHQVYANSCIDSIQTVVQQTRTRIKDLNTANRTNPAVTWSESIFNDCVVWLENRRSYQDTCKGSSTEWKSILGYLKQNTRAKLRKVCNQAGCECPNAINTIGQGGLPLFLQKVLEMNAQNTNFTLPALNSRPIMTEI